ncbi:MAG: gliding motility-associated C-terminal domain-containing protein [Flavobacteriales bacterium]|nr:gliding motility-associated C-terminal domain-containing protein [Flavobacteriales bacterium]
MTSLNPILRSRPTVLGALATLWLSSATAQVNGPMPTLGTDLWTGFMQNAYGAQETRLYISAPAATSGTVSIPQTGWSQAFSVPANGVVLVNVPTTAEHVGSESVTGKGVRIIAAAPVAVTAVSYQSYTHDGAQVLPVEALGTDYFVEAYRGLPGFNEFYKSELLIVATTDDTEVEITPSVNTAGGRPAGVPFTVTLDQGQTYQVQSALSSLDLTGTRVRATAASGPCRPFAVLSGSMCANVPVGCPACDHLVEQMIPLERWGTEFHTFLPTGIANATVRVLAGQNGTIVTVNGGAPIALNAGQSHQVNGLAGTACINATAPVSVVVIYEGYNCANAGDPSMVVIEPDDRTTQSTTFSTVSSPQITGHRVELVVPTAVVGQVTVDGTAVPAGSFTAFATCPTWSHASRTITAGTHRVSAPQGIHVYATGFGTGESYAFNANATVVPVVVQDSLLCVNGPVTLTAPEPMDNPQWEAASAPGVVLATGMSYSFTPTTNDTYTVSGTAPGSTCPLEFTFHVGIQVPVTVEATADGANAATICQYQPVQLGAQPSLDPNAYTLSWTPAALVSDPAIPDPVAYPMTTTWFKLNVTSPLGCGSATDSVLVQVTPNTVHSVEATTADSIICLGDPVQLGTRTQRVIAFDPLNSGTSALWAQVQGGAVSGACGAVNGNALLFNAAGTRQARTTPINVPQGGSLVFSLMISAGTAPCDGAEPGEDVVVEYSLNGVAWTVFHTLNESQYPAFTPITLAIPPAAWSAATHFRWRQLANSGAAQDVWALDNVTLTRVDNTGVPLLWSPGATLNDPTSPSPLATPPADTWYTVQATGGTGCTFSDPVFVQVAPAFSISAGNDVLLCGSGQAQLQATASSGQGIQWSWTPNNGSLNNTAISGPLASPGATTTYTATAINNVGCTASDAVTVTVGPQLGLVLSASDLTLCQGESSQLNAVLQGTGTLQLLWNNAGSLSSATSPNPVATPTGTTTYTATLTDTQTGCSTQASITIAVTTAYTIAATEDTTLCNALGFQLDVQHNVPAPFSIAWTPAFLLNSGSIASPTVMADTTMLFEVTITDANGCSVTDSVRITDAFDSMVNPVNIAGCAGQTLVLDAGFPGSTYAWTHGPTSQTVPVTTTDTYVVEITDAQGCQTTKTFNVVLNALPALDLGPDSLLCGASAFIIQANSPGNTVVWGNGSTGQQFQATGSGTYTATATSPQGCVSTDAVTLTFAPMPVDQLQDVTACATSPVTLDAGNAGSSYLWNTSSTGQSITVTTGGLYSVLVTNTQGCTGTFDALVTLVAPPVVDLGPDTTVCTGTGVVLDAGNPGSTYLWSTGAVAQTIAPLQSGTYGVIVTNTACQASDSVTLTVLPGPVDALVDVTECTGEPVLLDAGNPGATFAWSTGAVTPTIAPTAAGTYTVLVSTPQGCSASFSAVVTFVPWPVVDLGPDTALCQGDVLTLDAGNPGTTYTWSTGAVTHTIDVVQNGTYSVTVDNGHCSASDAVVAGFNPRPSSLPVHQIFTCLDEEPHYVVIDAGNPGSSFGWSSGQTSQIILAGAYGWYFVDITNTFNCGLRDSVRVNEFCPASIYVPNTFTPNADGINDTWGPVGKNVATLELIVFDRWGGVLWQTNDPMDQWDGTAHGAEVPNEVYVWKMRYRFVDDEQGGVGMEQERMGHVTIIR